MNHVFKRWFSAAVAAGWVCCGWVPAMAHDFPVEVRNCSDTARFESPPQRAIVNDVNMLQTVLDLGLAPRVVAVSAIRGREHSMVAPADVVTGLRQFSPHYPSLEAVLGENPDFMFAGWNYGFDAARGVTPRALAQFGIGSYTLRESCIRIGPREPMSMEVMYADVLALGAIFGVRPKAEALVQSFRDRMTVLSRQLEGSGKRPRVMYCGDCSSTSAPLSSGKQGMPALLAHLAGGLNVFDDIQNSYVRVSWEEVVQRDPEWIIVSDDRIPASRHIAHLLRDPQLRDVTAVRERRFIAVSYAQRSPSTRNVETVERIARHLHPERFVP